MTESRPNPLTSRRCGPGWAVGALALVGVLAGLGSGASAAPSVAPKGRPAAGGGKSVEVVVGPTGELGQWLTLGPVRLPGYGKKVKRLSRPLQQLTGGVGALRPGRPVRWVPRRGSERTLRWRLRPWRQPRLDVRKLLGMRRHHRYRAAFFGLVLQARRALTVYLTVGHDDGLAVWLNGARLLAALGAQSYLHDQRLVALKLRKGTNRLVLQLAHGRGRWRVQTRLTGPDHAPLGQGASRGLVRLLLPTGTLMRGRGATGADRWAAETLRFELGRKLTGQGLTFTLRGRTPAGTFLPAGGRLPLTLFSDRRGRRRMSTLRPGLRALAARGWSTPLATTRGARRKRPVRWVTVALPGRRRVRLRLWRAPRLCKKLVAARQRLRKVTVGKRISASSVSTVTYHLRDLRRLLEGGDRERGYLSRRLSTVARWGSSLARGKDPFPRMRGRLVKAYRSGIDGSYQPYSLYVPRGYTRRRRWPLYVMLHGLNCNHRMGLHQMLGTWMSEQDEAKLPWSRFLRRPTPPKVFPRALVLAPQAFGNSFYSHAGEVDVHAAIDEVVKHYRVDPRRVILVGHSMGGTGVLEIGLHRPDRFAGIVSLAGYPTRWIHAEIRKGPLKAWEKLQAQRYSPLLWTANGLHLPLIAVHGTRDGPYKSKGLVRSYKRKGYSAELKLFEYGHSVWRKYLDKGQVYRDTARWARPRRPARVVFETPSLRFNRSHWVQLDARPRTDAWSRVKARVRRGSRVRVRTKNVDQLTLLMERAPVRRGSRLRITIDKTVLQAGWKARLTLSRSAGRWRLGPRKARRATLRKRPGLAGPLDDLHHGPVLVVYGTGNKRWTAALKRVARRLNRHGGASVRYPVKADTAVTAADRKRYSLILVGDGRVNRETARYAKRLPFRINRKGVRLGRCRYPGDDVGVKLIHPNPDAPDRYLVVIAGTTPLGVLRHHLVPRYLPDFVVWDRTLERTAGSRILGPNRRFLAAGYFDRRWRLPGGLCPASRHAPAR